MFIAFGLPKHWHWTIVGAVYVLLYLQLYSFHFPLGYNISYKIFGSNQPNIRCGHGRAFSSRSVTCSTFPRLKGPKLVCALWLLVNNPSHVAVNLAFSGSSGHGPPQLLLLLLLLLEPCNSTVFTQT